ncbi:hypothetical protein [Bradyrhizobium sp. LTSP885]|uniref:hypothetical protein n=1 Tax=Bradyrhizobium sp. LTSP885 TaxID=1619232 RepID=UPI000AD672A2|nr:hypothetical protein [Bradyrhizobium sp. LTSP885]
MTEEIAKAVSALLQFASHTNRASPISRDDLIPVFHALANALSDIDGRLKEKNAGP